MAAWQEGFVTSNGLKIHYSRTGGVKPSVVLSHGATDDGICWTRLAQALEDDYDLILPDARGHGRSGSGKGEYSTTSRAADLAGLIDVLQLDRPVVLGHSMGAQTSLFTAALYGVKVRGAILEDPILILEGESVFGQSSAQDLGRLMHDNSQKLKRLPRFLLRQTAKKYMPTYPAVETTPWIESKKRLSRDFIRSLTQMHDEEPGMAVLARVKCPTLLITGDRARGAIVSPEATAKAQAVLPGLQVAHIAGSGHNIHRDQFETYLAAVKAFLQEVYGITR